MWNEPDGTKLDLCKMFGMMFKKSESLVAIPAAIISNLVLILFQICKHGVINCIFK